MEDHQDPVTEAEKILLQEQQMITAEATKMHAEMLLFASFARRTKIVAGLLHKGSQEGIDYMTGMVVAVGLTARNWGRVITDEPGMDFTKYINPEAEAMCTDVDGGQFAHYLVREVLLIENVATAEKLRSEMKAFAEQHSAETWAKCILHLVWIYGELMEAILDVVNGDFVAEPEDADDDR